MKGRYEAAFIVPVGANKTLGEDGWEFDTTNRLPEEVKKFLTDDLNLRFVENYLGIDSYVDENIKASVIYDDQNQIENVYFQVYGNAMPALSNIFQSSFIANKSELFVPRGDKYLGSE